MEGGMCDTTYSSNSSSCSNTSGALSHATSSQPIPGVQHRQTGKHSARAEHGKRGRSRKSHAQTHDETEQDNRQPADSSLPTQLTRCMAWTNVRHPSSLLAASRFPRIISPPLRLLHPLFWDELPRTG